MRNFEYGHDSPEAATQSNGGSEIADGDTALDSFDSLVLVSNRQPYRHTVGSNGDISVERPTGGLTAALDPVLERVGGTWIAWGDGDADRAVVDDNDRVRVPPEDPAYTLERVWIDDELADAYYNGYSNRLLWPVCHDELEAATIRPGDYDGYREVNEQFADRVTAHATADGLVWLQDYHLALAPSMIADRVPSSTTIGQFWHVPWPEPETFSRVPHARAVLAGLLGNDVLGFHVDRFVTRFLSCVEYFLDDASVDEDASLVSYDGSQTRVIAVPLGVDAQSHAEQSRAAGSDVYRSVEEALSIPDTRVLGLGVDRLDYTKGITERIRAIESLLERWPEWIESFTFVQSATPSRTDIPAYASYGESVRSTIDRVNDRFATDTWQPIVYTEEYLSRAQLCALYDRADLMLVTSRSDGMNLVAKEYLAASTDGFGALCLSEQAGAHDELGDAVYSVDPSDPAAIGETINEVLTAPTSDRQRRMRALREQVFDRTLEWWMDEQFEAFVKHKREKPLLSTSYPHDRS